MCEETLSLRREKRLDFTEPKIHQNKPKFHKTSQRGQSENI